MENDTSNITKVHVPSSASVRLKKSFPFNSPSVLLVILAGVISVGYYGYSNMKNTKLAQQESVSGERQIESEKGLATTTDSRHGGEAVSPTENKTEDKAPATDISKELIKVLKTTPTPESQQPNIQQESQANISFPASNEQQKTTNQVDVLLATYNQVKIESGNLSEGITFIQNLYNEVKGQNSKGLENCKYWYDSGVTQANSDAQSLKTSYSDSRTGYATQPSITNNIDAALEHDLAQLKADYESCKAKYNLNTSIESDIKKIKSDQSAIMSSLTKENSQESLIKIRALENKVLLVADKF